MKTEDQSKKDIRREKIRERIDKRIDRLEKRIDRLLTEQLEKSMFGMTQYEIERAYRKERRLRRKVAEANFLLLLMGNKKCEGGKHDEENR